MGKCPRCGGEGPHFVPPSIGEEGFFVCEAMNKLNKEKRMEIDELEIRFTYHSPKGDQPERYEMIRDKGLELATMMNNLCPDSRELSLAVTNLEQAIMWANAAIARRS